MRRTLANDLMNSTRGQPRPEAGPWSRWCVRALTVLICLLVLGMSSGATAHARTVNWRPDTTFDVTNTNSALASGPVPSGAGTIQVIVSASTLTSGNWNVNAYRIHGSCELTGGGTQTFSSAYKQYGLTGAMWSSAPSVSGCDSVTLTHENWSTLGSGAGTVTVSVVFEGASIPSIAVPSETILPVAERFTQDMYMAFAGDPVQSLTGNFAYSRADVVIPGRGPTPSFVRTYNSADTRDGPLGPGWTHNYDIRLRKPTGDTTGKLAVNGPSGRQDQYSFNSGSGVYAPPEGVMSRLVENADLTFTVTHKDNSSWTFDAGGKLIGIRDRHGNLSTLTYDGSGRLSTIGDPAGRGSLTLAYNGSGRLISVTDWASPARVVEFAYDTNTPSRLRTVTDREGNVTTYGYDGTSQRMTTITDANGHVAITQTYDGQGRVATQKDAKGLVTGQQTTFSYVTNGDGTKTTTVTSPQTSFGSSYSPSVADTYDTTGRLIKRESKPTSSSADDVVTEYTYDGDGNLSTAKDARGFTTTFCYDVGENGAAIQGSSRNLTRRIDPAPSSGGNVLVTLYSYDLKDNPTKVIPPLGVSSGTSTSCSTDLSSSITATYATTMTYDAAGVKLLSTTRAYTDPDSGAQTAKTTYEYDSNHPGLVSYVTPPRGNTGGSPDHTYATQFTYYGAGSKHGLLASVVDPLGNTTTFDYDAVGRRISMVDPNGNAGGATPSQHTWEYEYDKENRLRYAKAPAPSGSGSQLVSESRYDGVGNLLVRIDANGQVVKYLYDERDSLSEVWESPGAWTSPSTTPSPKYVTAYTYDHNGKLTRVTRASGDSSYERATDYAYDGLNRVRTETQYPSWPSTSGSLVVQTTYDQNSNPAAVIDQLNQTTTFSYDRLNRLTKVDYSSSGTPDVSYTYDANGQRLTMVDGTGTTTYSYDELGRPLSVVTPASPSNKTVGYRYDRDGNRTKLIYPGGDTVTYTFNKGNQLTSFADWVTPTPRQVSYTYFPDGALKRQTNPNGTVADYTYDNANRLTDLWNKPTASSTDAITRHQFTLDSVGNRTQVAELLAPLAPDALQPAPTALPADHGGTPSTAPTGLPADHGGTASTAPTGLPNRPGPSTSPTSQTLTYGYDWLYRLTSASGGPAGSTTYSYDPVGNRLTRVRNSISISYAYDRADRISSAGATSYTVNANGNQTARGSDSFSYDQANRLTGTTVGSTTASYNYDGAGKRASKTVNSTTTNFVYDINRSLPVLLEDGTRRYVWGLGLAYEVESGAALVYHVDGLGSVRAITNSSTAIVQTYDADEFGVPISAQGASSQPLGFAGEQYDTESGFNYLRARMYDPQRGRFIQRDFVPGRQRRSMTLNRFSYVENSPVNRVDPSGRTSHSLGSCGSISFRWPCTFARSCPFCPIVLQCTSGAQAYPPTREDCEQDSPCWLACEKEEKDCKADFARYHPEYPEGASGCGAGFNGCVSTGGCFHNPGWRQRMPGRHPRDEWDEVWYGRKTRCDE